MDINFINIILEANKKGLGVFDIYKNITVNVKLTYNDVMYQVLLLNDKVNEIKYYCILKDNDIIAYVYIDNDIYGVYLPKNTDRINMDTVLISNPIKKKYLKIYDILNLLKLKLNANSIHPQIQTKLNTLLYNNKEKNNYRILVNNTDYSLVTMSNVNDITSTDYVTPIIIYDFNTSDLTKNYYFIPIFTRYKYNNDTKTYDNIDNISISTSDKVEHFIDISKKHQLRLLNTNKKNNKKYIILILIIILIIIMYHSIKDFHP